MKKVSCIALLVSSLFTSVSFGQMSDKGRIDDWKSVAEAQHQSGRWMAGVGATWGGATVKAGRFVANRVWLGAFAESNTLPFTGKEIGLAGRYYLWNAGFASAFAEAGASYGRFQYTEAVDRETSNYRRVVYNSLKINAALGLECPIWRRVSIEGQLKLGRLTQVNTILPSLHISANVYLGK